MERPPDPTTTNGVRASTPADEHIKTQDEAIHLPDPVADGHQPAAGGADSATPQLCSSRTREGGLSTAQHDPAAQLRLSSVALCQALTPSSEGGDRN